MRFSKLVSYFTKLERTTKRLEMIDILTELLKETETHELEPVIYMVIGQLGPKYDEPVLGIAERMAIEALIDAAGVSQKKVQEVLNSVGDMGEAAYILLSKEKSSTLDAFLGEAGNKEETTDPEVLDIWKQLHQIAELTGEGSAKAKIRALTKILTSVSPEGAKYVMRIVLGKMRLGVADMTVVEAITRAYIGDKTKKPIVELAYFKTSNLAEIAKIAKEQGFEALEKIRVTPGRPVQCMAAQRLSDPEEILEKLGGKCQLEYKYDGLRFQYHYTKDNKAKLWSRRQENLTNMFPDVIEALNKAFGRQPIIAEGEIVAYNFQENKIVEFQTLMQMKI